MKVKLQLFTSLTILSLFACDPAPMIDDNQTTKIPEQVVPNEGRAKDTSNEVVIESDKIVYDWTATSDDAISSFSTEVDGASYSLLRARITRGEYHSNLDLRLEELVNYFSYNFAAPEGENPLAIYTYVDGSPWQKNNSLVGIAIKSREIKEKVPANLVFLIDVSGSMQGPYGLELIQKTLPSLVEQMDENDRITLVTYAGSEKLALPSTPGSEQSLILEAIQNLTAKGSTNGEGGLELAYEQANLGFKKDGINRVILCTDGDFNVGQTDPEALVEMIRHKSENGIDLSVLGFGHYMNDATAEYLSNEGDGNYYYIDSIQEGKKILVSQLQSTLLTVAKDTKLQVEFDQNKVASYRLLGYRNRRLSDDEYTDDKKDAGDLGAGDTVIAFYEVTLTEDTDSTSLGEVRIRFKQPQQTESKELRHPLVNSNIHQEEFAFARAVLSFGAYLTISGVSNNLTLNQIRALATPNATSNHERQGFIELFDQFTP